MEKELFVVSHAPHIQSADSIQRTMLDVVIALIPALIAGVFFQGYRAAVVTLLCVLSCGFCEWR